MDPLLLAVILGIVEGLTEFIPVSSTGHLILVGHLFGFVGEKAASFQVAIQLGAILSVVVLYRQRFIGFLARERKSNGGAALKGSSGLIRIGAATLPALIVGYLSNELIKEHLFTPATVSWALLVGGLGILAAEKLVKGQHLHSLEFLTVAQALGVGLFQVLALWPGTSRSAATIVGGMLLGMERKSAAEFSFLIAVPIMVAATGHELMQMPGFFSPEDFAQLAVGFIVSFVVALLAVKAFVSYLSRWSLAPFAYYRIILAVVFYYFSTGGLAF